MTARRRCSAQPAIRSDDPPTRHHPPTPVLSCWTYASAPRSTPFLHPHRPLHPRLAHTHDDVHGRVLDAGDMTPSSCRLVPFSTLLLAWAGFALAGDTITSGKIKVQLFAAPSFLSEVSVDAYNNQCLSLDNNLYVALVLWYPDSCANSGIVSMGAYRAS
jgi:hypothetical protein